MLTSLNAVVCPLRAGSATKHPLLEAPVLTPVTAEWKLWSGMYGALTACLMKFFSLHRETQCCTEKMERRNNMREVGGRAQRMEEAKSEGY